MTHNKLTCLFGHHDYSKELTEDKHGHFVYLCKICKRSGYRKHDDGFEEWSDYDEKGNQIHIKWNDGLETWREYNEEGNLIHSKWNDGEECWYNENENLICFGSVDGKEIWLDNNGKDWVNEKPKNWKYEKDLQ